MFVWCQNVVPFFWMLKASNLVGIFWSQSKMRKPPLRWILIFHVYEHWRKGVFCYTFWSSTVYLAVFAHGNQLDDNNSGWDRWFNYQQESSQCHTNSSLPSPKPTAKALENRPYLKREVNFPTAVVSEAMTMSILSFQCFQGSAPCSKQTWPMDINPRSNSKYIYFLKDHLLVWGSVIMIKVNQPPTKINQLVRFF